MQPDEAVFGNLLKAEVKEYYNPLPGTMPDTSLYNVVVETKTGVAVDKREAVRCLAARDIIYSDGSFSEFDGRIYKVISEDRVKDILTELIMDYDPKVSVSIPQLRDMLNMARIQCRDKGDWLDTDPDPENPYFSEPKWGLVVFANGILNLMTFKLLPFNKKIFRTWYIHADWDPKRAISDPDKIESVFKGIIPDPDLYSLFWQIAGYVIYSPKILPYLISFYGRGGCGKTTLVEMIEGLNGKDLTTHKSIDQLMGQFGLEGTRGKRINICGEAGANKSKITARNGELMKSIASGERVNMDIKHCGSVEATFTEKLLFCCNSVPDFGDQTSGMFRRYLTIPCRIDQDPKAMLHDRVKTPDALAFAAYKAMFEYVLLVLGGFKFRECAAAEVEKEAWETQDSVMDYMIQMFNTADPKIIRVKITEDAELRYTKNIYESYAEYTVANRSVPMAKKSFLERIRNEYTLVKHKVIWEHDGTRSTRDVFILAENDTGGKKKGWA